MNLFHHRFSRRSLLATTLASLVVLTACDTPPEPPETVVTGTVSYQGKPVTGGTIYFQMEDAEASRPYAGRIYDDGTYEVTYIVTGAALIAVDTGTEAGKETYVELPRRFSSPTKSGLEYTVVEGPQTYDVELK